MPRARPGLAPPSAEPFDVHIESLGATEVVGTPDLVDQVSLAREPPDAASVTRADRTPWVELGTGTPANPHFVRVDIEFDRLRRAKPRYFRTRAPVRPTGGSGLGPGRPVPSSRKAWSCSRRRRARGPATLSASLSFAVSMMIGTSDSRSHLPADVKARHPRQHHIEDHHRRIETTGCLEAFPAARGRTRPGSPPTERA